MYSLTTFFCLGFQHFFSKKKGEKETKANV